jgi:hypothetical protein
LAPNPVVVRKIRREELRQELYNQLLHNAQRMMRGERLDQALSATALAHEAYLGLGNSFANAGHLYAAAAEAMRRVLVDGARAAATEAGGRRGPH